MAAWRTCSRVIVPGARAGERWRIWICGRRLFVMLGKEEQQRKVEVKKVAKRRKEKGLITCCCDLWAVKTIHGRSTRGMREAQFSLWMLWEQGIGTNAMQQSTQENERRRGMNGRRESLRSTLKIPKEARRTEVPSSCACVE